MTHAVELWPPVVEGIEPIRIVIQIVDAAISVQVPDGVLVQVTVVDHHDDGAYEIDGGMCDLNDFEAEQNSGVVEFFHDLHRHDVGACCECGAPDHCCCDCPTFQALPPDEHPPYVRVHLSSGGWKPNMMRWYKDEYGDHYDSEFTGSGWATRDEAFAEARMIAENEGVTFREDLSDPVNQEEITAANIAQFKARFPQFFGNDPT